MIQKRSLVIPALEGYKVFVTGGRRGRRDELCRSGWKRLAAAFVTAKSSETSRTMLMILSDDSSSPSSLFTCGKLYYSFFFAAFFLPQLLLLGFHSSLREMINKIVISTDGNIGITRKGIKAFGKKNCPSVPLVVGIHL